MVCGYLSKGVIFGSYQSGSNNLSMLGLAIGTSTPYGIVNLVVGLSESHHETYHIDSANLYE